MIDWWTPTHDASLTVVFASLGTWLLVRFGRWEDGR